jgi:hypothetical protein
MYGTPVSNWQPFHSDMHNIGKSGSVLLSYILAGKWYSIGDCCV